MLFGIQFCLSDCTEARKRACSFELITPMYKNNVFILNILGLFITSDSVNRRLKSAQGDSSCQLHNISASGTVNQVSSNFLQKLYYFSVWFCFTEPPTAPEPQGRLYTKGLQYHLYSYLKKQVHVLLSIHFLKCQSEFIS